MQQPIITDISTTLLTLRSATACLLQLSLKLLSNQQCQDSILGSSTYNFATNAMICAASEWQSCHLAATLCRLHWRLAHGSLLSGLWPCANHFAGGASPAANACKGDSGGPLIVRGADASQDFQIGIVSWSRNCSDPGKVWELSFSSLCARR